MRKRPTQTEPEANAKPNAPEVEEEPFSLSRCDCCHVSDIGGAHGETGYPLTNNITLCCFCKLLFPQIQVPTVDLSNAEFLGAWGDFKEDIVQFHCSVSHHARSMRVEFNDATPDCLHSWLIGSVVESEMQKNAVEMLWPLVARERVLSLIEVAAVMADEYDHEVQLGTLHEVVSRDDVAPVWASWLASHAAKGKAQSQYAEDVKNKVQRSQWASYGESYVEHSTAWAATLAKEHLLRDKNKKQ